MAGFGKADIGLIKATAGAEAGQYIDENLMIGSAVGSAMNVFREQMKNQADTNAQLQKEADEAFKSIGGNPPKAFMDHLAEITPEYKNQFVANKGKDVYSKQAQQFAVDDFNGIVGQFEIITGNIEDDSSDDAEWGAGANQKLKNHANILQSGTGYAVETVRDPHKNGGYSMVNMAIPKEVKPDPTAFIHGTNGNSVQGILDIEADTPENREKYPDGYVRTEEDIALMARWDKANKKYTDWEALENKVDGRFNKDKFQIYNQYNHPRKQSSFENNTASLDYYNSNVANLKQDKDLLTIPPTTSFADGWKKTLNAHADKSGNALQDQIFGDMSRDDIDNSYAQSFIDGLDSEKHPGAYEIEEGVPLVFNYDDSGTSDADGAITYDSDEWKDLLVDGEHSDDQKLILENYLRGYSADGNVNNELNKPWLIDKLSNYMGVVTQEAFEIKRRDHFEQKGKFFNDGVDEQNVFTTKEVTLTRKKIAYNNAIANAAFPQSLLSNKAQLNERLDEDGSIAKALKKEFKEHIEGGDVAFDFDDNGTMEVTTGGVTELYDFTGDNAAEVLAQLKKDLSLEKDFNPSQLLMINGLSNSVDGDDWKKVKDRMHLYHGNEAYGFDSSANMPVNSNNANERPELVRPIQTNLQ